MHACGAASRSLTCARSCAGSQALLQRWAWQQATPLDQRQQDVEHRWSQRREWLACLHAASYMSVTDVSQERQPAKWSFHFERASCTMSGHTRATRASLSPGRSSSFTTQGFSAKYLKYGGATPSGVWRRCCSCSSATHADSVGLPGSQPMLDIAPVRDSARGSGAARISPSPIVAIARQKVSLV